MNIYFILVEPKVAENIGASARAIKTMGFNNLRLVNSENYLNNEAKWLAHGSVDILENAEVFSSFKESIKDLDFVIGTTAKQHKVKYDYYDSCNLLDLLLTKQKSVSRVGIIFGCEESGLKNSEIKRCDIISTVALKNNYPSLNLSQAVMIYAYNLSQLTLNLNYIKQKKYASDAGLQLKNKVIDILKEIEIGKNKNLNNRIMERLMLLCDEDIQLAHSICNNLNKRLKI